MGAFRRFLEEKFWYHGQPNPWDSSYDFDSLKGNMQDGPGIYFTNSLEEAENYGQYVIKAVLSPNKIIKKRTTPNIADAKKLIKMSKNYDRHLENYDDSEEFLMSSLIDKNDEYETFINIWGDLYRLYNDDKSYVENCTKLGYDALLTYDNGNDRMVVYNPKIIKVIK